MADIKPNTSYSWNNDQEFPVTGKEFETLLNTSRALLGTPEAQMVLFLKRVNDIFENVLIKGIESGVIVEASQPVEVLEELEEIPKSKSKKK
jgi:hypothetical protein